jgi:hypothetical protein
MSIPEHTFYVKYIISANRATTCYAYMQIKEAPPWQS